MSTLNVPNSLKLYQLETRPLHNGEQFIFKFLNGYGASVINNSFSYSSKEAPWEVAVIKFLDDGEWEIVYDTPVTDNVLGYLTDSQVAEALTQIKNLPK